MAAADVPKGVAGGVADVIARVRAQRRQAADGFTRLPGEGGAALRGPRAQPSLTARRAFGCGSASQASIVGKAAS
jgi:hypothetical protein